VGKVLVALLVLGIPVWAGDPEVAKFLLDKGKKEARAKNYEEAESLFRRSIAEFPPNPEACYEHGQVLAKLDRGQAAMAAYNACIEAVDKEESPSSKWKSVGRRAARALSKLKKQFAGLDKINRKYLPKFLAFGKLHYKSNPRWSRRAFEAVLAIDPTNASAKAYLAKLPSEEEIAKGGGAPDTAEGKGWGKPLIDKGTLKNWEPGSDATWSISGSVITADAKGPTGFINWLDQPTFHGKFALQFKFRVVRDGADRRTVGFFLGNGKDAWWALMIERDNTVVLLRYEGGRNTAVASRTLDAGIKMSSWHSLRFDIDNDEDVQISVDGKVLIEMAVPRRQKFEGQMGFFVQSAKAQFKDLELRK